MITTTKMSTTLLPNGKPLHVIYEGVCDLHPKVKGASKIKLS